MRISSNLEKTNNINFKAGVKVIFPRLLHNHLKKSPDCTVITSEIERGICFLKKAATCVGKDTDNFSLAVLSDGGSKYFLSLGFHTLEKSFKPVRINLSKPQKIYSKIEAAFISLSEKAHRADLKKLNERV